MTNRGIKQALALSTALTLSIGIAAPAFAQDTPGDRSGTPTAAGAGQSAATSTNAPAPSVPTRASSNDSGNADIIVTARRVEERLQDVPISITVFNQQQISNRNVTDPTGLALYTPSLSANNNFGSENTSFAIRGFVQDAGTQPSVGVYFADVVALRGPTQGTQAGDSAGPGDFFDLQNVQVLKGPQGTLQGRNTTGGAVLFVPQKPTSKYEGYVEGSYGNYDMKRIQGMLNLPLSDIARFRIAVDHQERDGYLKNISGVGPNAYNNIDYTAVRASLVVDLTPDIENYTILSYSRSRTNGSNQKLIGCNPTGGNATGFTDPTFGAGVGNFLGLLSCGQLAREKSEGAGFYDSEAALANPLSYIQQYQAINTTTWRASDNLTIKNIASYGQFIDKQRSPLFGTNFQRSDLPPLYQALFGAGVPAIFTDIIPAPGLNTADQYTTTEELQLQGSALDSKLTYQGGLYFEYSGPLGSVGNQSNQVLQCASTTAPSCTDVIGLAFTGLVSAGAGTFVPVNVGALNHTVGETTFRDEGVYAQASYALTSKLKLTGGIRYTRDRQTNNSTRYYYQFTVTPPYNQPPVIKCTDPTQAPSCSESLRQKSQKPTWLIDLDYKPTDDILAYAKYSRGYRSGGVFSNAPADHRTFAPEKVDAYEAGLKTSFRGALHGTLDVAGFYNNFSNQQLQLGFNTNPNFMGTGFPAPVSPTTGIVNAGKSRIWGVEVDSSITPFRGLTLNADYTYLNATIRKIAPFGTTDPNYIAAQTSIAPGSPLALSPKNKVSATATYTLPFDESIGRISVGATFTHTDKQLTNYVYQTPAAVALFGHNFGYINKQNLLNLNLNWSNVAGLPVDVAVFATNVTDKHYYNFIAGLGGLTGAGNEFATIGEPRFYGGRIRYHF
jgi:iron complex outermembrane receptor protein